MEKKLHKTLDVLEDHPQVAQELIRDVLATESEDSFLLIELSQIFLILSPGENSLEEVAPWLERADPTAFPAGFFQVASLMGANRCESCREAALGILEFETLAAYIDQHALPVDLDLGMLFVLGPYGETIEGSLRSRLVDGSCVQRRNAARMIRLLLPRSFPEELATIVLGDACDEAKAEAWLTIGVLGHPGIIDLVATRLSDSVPPVAEEKLGMVAGLGGVYLSYVYGALESLAGSAEAEVARAAATTHEELVAQESETEVLIGSVGSAEPGVKAEMREKLRLTVDSSVFDFSGSARELEANIDTADLELLNAARASVLRRASDECLYEFRKLHLAAMLVRQLAANSLVAVRH